MDWVCGRGTSGVGINGLVGAISYDEDWAMVKMETSRMDE